jgi:aspartyl-tRNA(Asn)/glutamyl-tRNA(Gln) amidotransferase subunit A
LITLHARPISEIAADVRSGRLTATAVTTSALDAIDAGEGGPASLNAFLARDREAALRAAAAVDARPAAQRGALAGVPVAVKDNLCTTDFPTTCASRFLAGYRSPYDATVVRRLREAGAIVVGKTNLDEFAMGSSTENSAFGPTRNPHDHARVPGGSSGGSAAAVAARMVPAALGSETSGSVRQPAALCGVVGVRPTYGRVSRYGLIAFSSSLDQVGPLALNVADAALLLRVLSGADPFDATCATRDAAELEPTANGIAGMVVGVPREYFPDDLDADVKRLCSAALERLGALGATLRDVSLPHTSQAIPTYYVLAPAEASSNLARLDGVRFGARAKGTASITEVYEESRSQGFGAEVKRRIMLGSYILSSGYYERHYGRAQQVRGLIAEDFRRAFASGIDVLFAPTAPGPAFRFGEKTSNPYEMYLADVFVTPSSLAALPAVSLPVGETGGLPIGAQFIAPWWREAVMLRAAAALERSYA